MSLEPTIFPHDGFTMTIMSKVCRCRSYRLAIINDQHAPNIYSKAYLIEDNICKLSVCDSPWVTIYHLFFSATTVTSWPGERRNHRRFTINSSKNLRCYRKNIVWHMARRDENYVVSKPCWWRKIIKMVVVWSLSVDFVDCSIPGPKYHNFWRQC